MKPNKISVLAPLLAAALLAGCAHDNNLQHADFAPTGPNVTVLTYNFTVSARPEDWQHSGLELHDGDSATIIASGKWRVVRESDSGGDGIAADNSFALPGRPEGCLIVRMSRSSADGDTLYFKGNNQPVYDNKPGEFCFLANDSLHPDDNKGRHGYKDNKGELKVTIKIQTAKPGRYPPVP